MIKVNEPSTIKEDKIRNTNNPYIHNVSKCYLNKVSRNNGITYKVFIPNAGENIIEDINKNNVDNNNNEDNK